MELSEILALRNILLLNYRKLNTVLITNKLQQSDVISKDQCKELWILNSRIDQHSMICDYIDKIGSFTSFKNFTSALRDAGYSKLCNQLLDEHSRLTNGITHDVEKNTLKYEIKLTQFYVDMKIKADSDDQLESGKPYLKLCIQSLDAEIEKTERGERSATVQLLFDMRIVLYTLLSQKYSNIRKREQVLLKMRYDHPAVKDTKLYDLLFPSGLSIICAADGISSATHDERVETVVDSSSSPLLAVLANLAKLYKNDICQQKFDLTFTDHTKEATKVYETCLQLTNDFTYEECKTFRTVINLERAHALLGINWNFQVCDIQRITTENLKQARDILIDVVEPDATRRKLWYFMCKGRQFELCDILMAKRYIQRAFECAVDKRDKGYIKQYLTFLACEKRPRLMKENVVRKAGSKEKYTRKKQERVLKEDAEEEIRRGRAYGKTVTEAFKNIRVYKSINNRFAYFRLFLFKLLLLLSTLIVLWCITLWF